ncbi:hypothetical protein LTS10_008684 [Elasticomyces elasticus]|nr:hypothetical protein LTS10_008684 [Elasticomyces elasticus]
MVPILPARPAPPAPSPSPPPPPPPSFLPEEEKIMRQQAQDSVAHKQHVSISAPPNRHEAVYSGLLDYAMVLLVRSQRAGLLDSPLDPSIEVELLDPAFWHLRDAESTRRGVLGVVGKIPRYRERDVSMPGF